MPPSLAPTCAPAVRRRLAVSVERDVRAHLEVVTVIGGPAVAISYGLSGHVARLDGAAPAPVGLVAAPRALPLPLRIPRGGPPLHSRPRVLLPRAAQARAHGGHGSDACACEPPRPLARARL